MLISDNPAGDLPERFARAIEDNGALALRRKEMLLKPMIGVYAESIAFAAAVLSELGKELTKLRVTHPK